MRPKKQIFMLVAVPSQEVNSPFHLSGVLFVRMYVCVCAVYVPLECGCALAGKVTRTDMDKCGSI